MVVTRSQDGKEQATGESSQQPTTGRIFEEPPESPSAAGEARSEPPPMEELNTRRVVTIRAPPQATKSNTSVSARVRAAELAAAEQLAAIRRKELELEAELVKRRLAAEIEDINETASEIGEQSNERVEGWLREQPISNTNPVIDYSSDGARGENLPRRPQSPGKLPRKKPVTPAKKEKGMEQLTETFDRMARPSIRYTDLPTFNGAFNEWLSFKAAMVDSTNMYGISAAENLQRLRSCLKGDAKEAVSALLYAATDPDVIMQTLEQSFGRPEIIVDRALEDLRKVPKPGTLATELNNFAIKLQNVVYILKSIDKKGFLYSSNLVREILDKLSPHIKSRWCDYANENEGTAEPEVVVLSRFLMREADRALRYTYTSSSSTATPVAAKRESRSAGNKRKATAVYNTNEEKTEVCPCCGLSQLHTVVQCPKYKEMTVNERWRFLKEQHMCFKCAQKKHRKMQCKAKPCGVNDCRRPHHATLHNEYNTTMEATIPTATSSSSEAVLSMAVSTNKKRSVLLKVCPVVIVGPKGRRNTFALFDEGATVTLIDEDLAKSVGATGPAIPLHIRGVNMQQELDSHLVTLQIRSRNIDSTLHKLKARTVKNLQLHEQSVPEEMLSRAEHLHDLKKEEVCYKGARPGILIGTDQWEFIVSRELRVGRPGQPAASRTQLGWVIHGTVPQKMMCQHEDVLHIVNTDQTLHEMVEHHFKIEALGVTHQPRISDANQRAQKIVESTFEKCKTGYEVGLPWREDDVRMPPSYDLAFKRLRNIEQKIDRIPEFAEAYTAQIDNLLKKGYAEPCDGSEAGSKKSWFLPHFAVQNPNKPGKYRLVFDAAAKSNGVSLNDYLLEGPDLLQSLLGILFRFREKSVAITADIQEMFLQIKIRREDQPAQQFLWRGNDRKGPPQHYKMTSMIFGAASSPFMAHFVRNRNAEIHKEEYPLAFEAITRNHYMDDLVTSYENEDEARTAIKQIRRVHSTAGFTLRGWNSNRKDVLQDVPQELYATTPTTLGGGENKILGMFWNPDRDELGFNTSMNRVPVEVRDRLRAPTKREALSAVMSIYDPLGLLSHYTIRARIILQNLWRLKTTWDEPIPEEEDQQFSDWLLQLEQIKKLRLQRCYQSRAASRIELHIMCDASEQAYAAVAYWRIITEEEIDTVLVAAKAKVAPRRAQTIPRLELQAALIGARLAESIKKEHQYDISGITYWTDSTTVVQWIRSDSQKYTPFVAHRLGEIAELTNPEEWKWLPTADNVADDATRLVSTQITDHDRWFRGPSFLRLPEEQWPAEKELIIEDILHTEEVLDDQKQEDRWLPDPRRFSKYETMLRTVARVLAFIDICRHRATHMTCEHIQRAEQYLIKKIQEESFHEEIKKIKNGRQITKSSRLFRLDPVLEEGILRVRGRIDAATAPQDMKRPVILDGRHPITKLLVHREHCNAGHANRERVTNDLRQRYWVIHLRPTVRAVERSCALCRVRRSRPQTPATGDLPRARLDPFHRPFTNCGVDYFGPMMVKVGRRREKRWGALFTCLTLRAVHLELVSSLSTDSAIMALRRMGARRGWPSMMYSDNATNFRGADQELKKAYAEWMPVLRTEGQLHRMEWRYIPPGAPNQGGAWERLVRSVKTALAVTLKEKTPPEEVLQTLLTEAEFSINARPLTHVSVSPHDPEALTPNHFLLGSSSGLPTTGPCDAADRRTWRASQALADHFWRRWLREYLPSLVPRGEPTNHHRHLQPGDIVVVADHMLPRNVWPMGVVERAYPGPDGGVRVVDVRTKTGVFKRPASKLVVLQREEEASRAAPGGEMLRTPSIANRLK